MGRREAQDEAALSCILSLLSSKADPKAVLLTSLHLGTFQPTQWKLVSERINEAHMNGSAVHIMEQCTGYSDKERQRM